MSKTKPPARDARNEKIIELEGVISRLTQNLRSCAEDASRVHRRTQEKFDAQQCADSIMLASLRHELERLSKAHQTALEANAPFRNRAETLERDNVNLRVRADRAEAVATAAKKHFSERGFWLTHAAGNTERRSAIPDTRDKADFIVGWTDDPRAVLRWFRYGTLEGVETGQDIAVEAVEDPDA